jgi:hypothetical protein
MVTNNFENKSFMQSINEKAQHALMRGPVFFFEEGGWKRGIFCFFLVLKVFLLCSHGIPRYVSKSTSDLSHMVCRRFNSHLSMKEGSLFCFVLMRSTKSRGFRLCSYCLWKALNEEGCMGLDPWCFVLAVQKFLNTEWFLHYKLN